MSRLSDYLVAACLALMLTAGVVLLNNNTVNAEPGSSTDPLISKSYVDDKINQVIAMIGVGNSQSQTGSAAPTMPSTGDYNEIVTGVVAQLRSMYGDNMNISDSASSFVPVNAAQGQIIIGNEGTEIILRSGAAVGYCGGENGVVDATDGIEIFNNEVIKPNHILIVPRDDFRGVRVTEAAWFIIKGDFSIIGG